MSSYHFLLSQTLQELQTLVFSLTFYKAQMKSLILYILMGTKKWGGGVTEELLIVWFDKHPRMIAVHQWILGTKMKGYLCPQGVYSLGVEKNRNRQISIKQSW